MVLANLVTFVFVCDGDLFQAKVRVRTYINSCMYVFLSAFEIADDLVQQFIPDDPTKRERLSLPREM